MRANGDILRYGDAEILARLVSGGVDIGADESPLRASILAQINALVAPKLFGEPVDHALVDIIPTQVGVARRGLDFKDAFTHFENRHVERTATEVEDQHGLTGFFVQAVGQRRGGGLIDDAQHIQTRDLPGVPRGGALGVIEIGRYRDDGIGDFFPQVLGSVLHQLAQDHSRNLLRRILLTHNQKADRVIRASHNFVRDVLDLRFHFRVAASYEPLGRIDGVFRIEHCLASGQLAYQALSHFGKRHHRRGQAVALAVDDHRRLPAFHHGNDRICRAQVNAYCLCHTSPHSVHNSPCSFSDPAYLEIVA